MEKCTEERDNRFAGFKVSQRERRVFNHSYSRTAGSLVRRGTEPATCWNCCLVHVDSPFQEEMESGTEFLVLMT